ncbi:MAG: hypothetical protein LBV74_07380 [Tannerella sp.]|jgi:hypothetical protein|nr:hypothetical protein [Tannerella sp.]
MRKLNWFKAGAMAYMLLGALHLVSQTSKSGLSENVLQTFAEMKATTFNFMGQHDLMQFYTGFSITMGFMLFAFGLQAFLIKYPTLSVYIANAIVSIIASVLAILYFHPLAWSFLLFATLSFTIGAVSAKKQGVA